LEGLKVKEIAQTQGLLSYKGREKKMKQGTKLLQLPKRRNSLWPRQKVLLIWTTRKQLRMPR
jgi:hypothetical protein